MTRSSKLFTLSISAAIVAAFSVSHVFAWTGPTQTPPGGNTSPPINTGIADQTKTGGLLNVFNLWVDGALGVTGGVTAAQYCFTGGIDCVAAWPASQWTLAGTSLYYTAGKVGIGTMSPRAKLDVAGEVKVGNTSLTCNASTAGALRYNSGAIEYCNGATWGPMAGGSGGPAPGTAGSQCSSDTGVPNTGVTMFEDDDGSGNSVRYCCQSVFSGTRFRNGAQFVLNCSPY